MPRESREPVVSIFGRCLSFSVSSVGASERTPEPPYLKLEGHSASRGNLLYLLPPRWRETNNLVPATNISG